MLAKDLILDEFVPLSPSDDIRRAKELFIEYCICHIPVVKNKKFLGSLPIDIALSEGNEKKKVSDFKNDYHPAKAYDFQYPLNIVELITEAELTGVPVVMEDNTFVGVIPGQSLFSFLVNHFSFRGPGGIFTLELGIRDYDISEISRIIESNNAKIIYLLTHYSSNSSKIYVTIKVDKSDVSFIRATFERFQYLIHVHQDFDTRSDELKDRYDLLMKYLKI